MSDAPSAANAIPAATIAESSPPDTSINGRLVQWLHAASVDFSASSREEAASLQSGRSALGQGLQTEPIERSSAPTFIARPGGNSAIPRSRSEEHTAELQSLMHTQY